ncbi:MAG TPA: hypothetical protein VJX67_08545 [Blastocatellia bacterium]|nr:hypothetical protein [Blastocatellia bacterium]
MLMIFSPIYGETFTVVGINAQIAQYGQIAFPTLGYVAVTILEAARAEGDIRAGFTCQPGGSVIGRRVAPEDD